MLDRFIVANRDAIVTRCRAKAASGSESQAPADVNDGLPGFLDQLAETLYSGGNPADLARSAEQSGHDLLVAGCPVSQVVHEYCGVCRAITGLAAETGAPVTTSSVQTLNACFDEVMSRAVTTWTEESQESRLNLAARRDSERVGFLVHEIRNLVNTAMVSFDVLRLGEAGVTGSTAAVLQRTLMALRALIARSIEEIRSTSSVTDKSHVLMTPFIDEVGAGAKLEADSRGLTLVVSPVQDDLAVEAERQVLAAVVRNLLQNAFKFTRLRSTVTLHVHGSDDRVLIEIGDECGGLPGEVDAKELPASFEQRGDDRTGLGVGLAFSRWGVEANGGRLYARNLPGTGCVFTVDLPRCSGASTSTLTAR